jgi:hypothetical protein
MYNEDRKTLKDYKDYFVYASDNDFKKDKAWLMDFT